MSGWPRNWQAAVIRVLEIVTKLPEALPFSEPVPLDEVPGYREQITNPMDLGTILGRAKADAYDTPVETLDDVRQVCCWSWLPHARSHKRSKLLVDTAHLLLDRCHLSHVCF